MICVFFCLPPPFGAKNHLGLLQQYLVRLKSESNWCIREEKNLNSQSFSKAPKKLHYN